jgi:hypothetical protein
MLLLIKSDNNAIKFDWSLLGTNGKQLKKIDVKLIFFFKKTQLFEILKLTNIEIAIMKQTETTQIKGISK